MGVVAVAAAMAGMGGQAASTVALASDVEELAEYVEFELNGEQYMPFVRLAEKIFTVLGIQRPRNVDLVQSSKVQRTLDDAPEYGTFYFRY